MSLFFQLKWSLVKRWKLTEYIGEISAELIQTESNHFSHQEYDFSHFPVQNLNERCRQALEKLSWNQPVTIWGILRGKVKRSTAFLLLSGTGQYFWTVITEIVLLINLKQHFSARDNCPNLNASQECTWQLSVEAVNFILWWGQPVLQHGSPEILKHYVWYCLHGNRGRLVLRMALQQWRPLGREHPAWLLIPHL